MPGGQHRIPVGDQSCVNGHTVMITDRGGALRIMELKEITEVRWSRLTDQRSTATITITGESCRRQAAALSQIEPRRHEVVIYRGADRVWEGPIRYVRTGRSSVTIHAADVLEFLAYRPLTKWWPGPDNGGPSLMTDRVEEILTYELTQNYATPGAPEIIPAWENLDPPIDVLPYLDVQAGTILTRADVLPFEMTVFEHLTNLARGGLDFTTVGRRIVVWDAKNPLGMTKTLTENDVSGDPYIYADGESLVTVQHVVASPEEGAAPSSTKNVGSYVRDHSFYGPWAALHTRNEEDSESVTLQDALNTQARNLSVGGVPVPTDLIVGSSASLRLDRSLNIQHLVAGVEIPVVMRLSGREMQRTLRLVSLTVSETAQGESVTANIGNPANEEEVLP